ncbi:MAG: hypothetical protein U1F54_15105 [Burkholderiales bacterium]
MILRASARTVEANDPKREPDRGLLASNEDPIAAQVAAQNAVSRLRQVDVLDLRQLEVLLSLDRLSRRASGQLLARYVEGNAQVPAYQRRDWSAALRLSQCFSGAYQRFWQHIRSGTGDELLAHAHLVLFQLLHHRQVEFLLRLMRYKKRIAAHWAEINEIYRFALTHALVAREAVSREWGREPRTTTLEQKYINILLLDALNNGQLSPREALWADGWLADWSRSLRLSSKDDGAPCTAANGFFVDLDSAEGLKRTIPSTAVNVLCLDTSQLQALIARGAASMTKAAANSGPTDFAARAGQVALLKRLELMVAPVPVRVSRRGERRPVAMTVQGIAGFASIAQVLREEQAVKLSGASMQEAQEEGITISPLGAERDFVPVGAGAGIDPRSAQRPVVPRIWQVKDSSESGCRIRGQIDDLNQLIPGTLIATRETAGAPWEISVVRRFRRLMADYVELGVELVGRKPRFVKLVVEGAPAGNQGALNDANNVCIIAFYLPSSEARPTMPIKTLLLPARHFTAGSIVTLLSANANYTLRLGQPIRQQFEFVCVPFTVQNRQSVPAGASEENS